MAHFDKGPQTGPTTPFGKNSYLRSTQDVKYESFTFAKGGIPEAQIDGTTQKVLQPGTVVAKITAVGPDQGKIGVFSAAATDGRQTLANIVGIVDTFLPWQLKERDVEVGVAVEARVYQARCFEFNASGAPVPLSNTTADALVGKKTLSILFA